MSTMHITFTEAPLEIGYEVVGHMTYGGRSHQYTTIINWAAFIRVLDSNDRPTAVHPAVLEARSNIARHLVRRA